MLDPWCWGGGLQSLGEMSWQLRVLPGAQQGHCIPRKDCVGHTKTQVHLVYSPPTKLPGGSTKTLDVKLHTGCPSNTEVNRKKSGEQERWCPPKDGHVPFSTTGQPGERRSSKEGSVDRWGQGLGGGASRPTCPGRGRLILCPTPGKSPQTLPPRGRPRTHVGCTYARRTGERQRQTSPE